MSLVTGLASEPNKTCKKSLYGKNNSGELDVFEAARYFSGGTPGHENETIFSQKSRNERRDRSIGARMSLDMLRIKSKENPGHNNPLIIHPDRNPVADQKQLKENKKSYKQPSSPGGRLASFLNALFNQTASRKKKKSKSGSSKLDLDQEEINPVWPRKRRSSISDFTITSSKITNDSKSIYSSSSSGFRTPPPCAATPTKSYKEFMTGLSRPHENAEKLHRNIILFKNDVESFGFSERSIINDSTRNHVMWTAENDQERDRFRKFSDVDDGADTDSSSDLFDLPNHDLDFYSNSLPVYGTTHIDRIRIAAPISSAATV